MRARRFLLVAVCLVWCASMLVTLGQGAPGAQAGRLAQHQARLTVTTKVKPMCVTNPDGTCYRPCWQIPNRSNCDYEDPYAAGCASHGSVTTLVSRQVYAGGTLVLLIEQRYSTACQSRWTRVTPEQSESYYVDAAIGRGTDTYGCLQKFADAYDEFAGTTTKSAPLYTNVLYAPQNDSAGQGCSVGKITYHGTIYGADDVVY
jgi:hypothetical protein